MSFQSVWHHSDTKKHKFTELSLAIRDPMLIHLIPGRGMVSCGGSINLRSFANMGSSSEASKSAYIGGLLGGGRMVSAGSLQHLRHRHIPGRWNAKRNRY